MEFNRIGNTFTSVEVFLFDSDKFSFKYRYLVNCHEYQDNMTGENKTRYQVYMIVDDESVHERYKDYHFKEREHGFLIKKVEKKGGFNENDFEKLVEQSLKVNIETKIKVDKYQKIKGILTGSEYYI